MSRCLPDRSVRLSERTTLAVGGLAHAWLDVANADEVCEALGLAAREGLAAEVVGGGSNLLVADRGLEAVVVHPTMRGIEVVHQQGEQVLVEVGAGQNWDEFVAWAVDSDLAGVECLSGIPGDVGACPIQNVGAYGQDVSHTIQRVQTLRRRDGKRVEFTSEECGFRYRDSVFKKGERDKHVVLSVRFLLHRGGTPTLAYPELVKAMEGPTTLASVRDKIISLRRRKSMVLDPHDENCRSAGSFFMNPIVTASVAHEAEAAARRFAPGESMPQFPAEGGVKLSAAWLIERAGMKRGTQRGNVGISTRHSLALVNRGGAKAVDLVSFASEVKACVREKFGVVLKPEPRLLGFDHDEIAALVN